jgi:DNA-binding CsgD family transcriptional regulator
LEHVRIFCHIATLIIGGMAISYIYIAYKHHRIPSLKPLMYFLIFFDLKLLITLLQWYYRVNLEGTYQASDRPVIFPLFGLHIILLFCLTTYALLFFILKLDGFRISLLHKRILIAVFSLEIIIYAIRLYFLVLDIPHDWLGNLPINSVFTYVFYFLTFVFLIQLLIESRKESNIKRSKTIRSFGYFYLVLYTFFFISGYFPVSPQIFIILATKVLFNLFPVFWIKAFLLKSENAVSLTVNQVEMDEVKRKYGITQRESEITKLLLQGKSNKEIADQLCIAHHTVKNHIYRLYQKLDVNKRYQLVHFFLQQKNAKSTELETRK